MDGSFLALGGSDAASSRWTARAILSSPLGARLAVLSACQTGLGRTVDAGMIGLARAFQLAGVPRVVMSLWSVSDAATAELMRDFVGRLAAASPEDALRAAMLSLRAHRPDPAEWAPFVLFGSPVSVSPGDRIVFASSAARAPSAYRLVASPAATTLRFGQALRFVARTADGKPSASKAPEELRLLYLEPGAGHLVPVDAVRVPAGAPGEIAFPRELTIGPPAGLERFALLSSPAPLAVDRLEKARGRSVAELLASLATVMPAGGWSIELLLLRSKPE
jgi:hypothetical protein